MKLNWISVLDPIDFHCRHQNTEFWLKQVIIRKWKFCHLNYSFKSHCTHSTDALAFFK